MTVTSMPFVGPVTVATSSLASLLPRVSSPAPSASNPTATPLRFAVSVPRCVSAAVSWKKSCVAMTATTCHGLHAGRSAFRSFCPGHPSMPKPEPLPQRRLQGVEPLRVVGHEPLELLDLDRQRAHLLHERLMAYLQSAPAGVGRSGMLLERQPSRPCTQPRCWTAS